MPRRSPSRTALAVLVVLVCLWAGPAPAVASQQEDFRQALAEFKALLDSPAKAQYRDNWQRVHGLFQDVLNLDQSGPYAAKSLYYMARTYEELGRRSFLAADNRRAVDGFQRAVNRFEPGHSWTDDCLYRKADILANRLGESRAAAEDLRRLLRDHASGDHAPKARALLAEIEKESAASGPGVAPAAAAAPAPRSDDAALAVDYQRAVNRFSALRSSKKKHSRETWLAAYQAFSRVYTTDPAGPHAAKALYFMGFVYDELGRRSGQTTDIQRAVDYYERAARLFPADSTWTDDALFRKAMATWEMLGHEDQAYADLLLVVNGHPDGDQAAGARAVLRRMDQARVKDLPLPEPALAAPAAPALQAPAPALEGALAPGMALLTDVRQRSTDDYTRVVLDLDGPAARYEDHRLPADPANKKSHRMYIDVDGARLAKSVPAQTLVSDGFLSSVRAGQYDPDTARVVLDFEKPQKYHIFTLENPFRIVIDVFADVDGAGQGVPAPPAPALRPSGSGTTARSTEAAKQAAKDILAQLGMTVQTILIDAGHGGRDPGAVREVRVKDKSGRYVKKIVAMEKDITLRAAMILGRTLQARGYKVLYTRTDDTKVSLEDRSVLGNIKKADMFISLHCNANHSDGVRGIETYYLSKASNEKILRLAAYENGVDPLRISDTQKIVMDLVYSFKVEESKSLARHVQARTVRTVRASYSQVNDHGARGAPFFVLIGTKMPAILVEMGYITNDAEAKLLESEAYLKSVAEGIAQGIDVYAKNLTVAGM